MTHLLKLQFWVQEDRDPPPLCTSAGLQWKVRLFSAHQRRRLVSSLEIISHWFLHCINSPFAFKYCLFLRNHYPVWLLLQKGIEPVWQPMNYSTISCLRALIGYLVGNCDEARMSYRGIFHLKVRSNTPVNSIQAKIKTLSWHFYPQKNHRFFDIWMWKKGFVRGWKWQGCMGSVRLRFPSVSDIPEERRLFKMEKPPRSPSEAWSPTKGKDPRFIFPICSYSGQNPQVWLILPQR